MGAAKTLFEGERVAIKNLGATDVNYTLINTGESDSPTTYILKPGIGLILKNKHLISYDDTEVLVMQVPTETDALFF